MTEYEGVEDFRVRARTWLAANMPRHASPCTNDDGDEYEWWQWAARVNPDSWHLKWDWDSLCAKA